MQQQQRTYQHLAGYIQDEVIEQVSYVREWGAKFITVIPEIRVS